MKRSFFSAVALGCCWMFSPESLALIGNLAGQAGWPIFIPFALITLCFMSCAGLLHNQHLPEKNFPGAPQNTFSSILISTLTLAASLPLTIISATAVLVTAGYTFNEVFLYWFPNFGFAFLLLALITALQFFSDKVRSTAQIFFIGMAIIGLLILSLYGIFSSPDTGVVKILAGQDQPGDASLFSWQVFVLLPLIYVGTLFPGEKQNTPIFIFAIGFLLFLIWLAASFNTVTLERLASSGIPYMTTARKILGDPGRYIMGIVVIAGSCGAVNGFFMLCQRMLISPMNKKREKTSRNKGIDKILPITLAICTGVAMATGLAGEELLEVLLRAALFLWILYITTRCVAALFWLQKKEGMLPLPALLSTAVLLITLLGILVGDHEKKQLILCIISALSTGMLIAICQFSINNSTRKEKKT